MAQIPVRLGRSAIQVFEARGLTPAHVVDRLRLLYGCLGAEVISRLLARPVEDQATTISIADSSCIIGAVHKTGGAANVFRAIRASGEASLHEPVGEWLQLTVGAFFKRFYPDLDFEQRVDGSAPKDLVLEPNLQIETKAFSMSPVLKAVWTRDKVDDSGAISRECVIDISQRSPLLQCVSPHST
jgi:hypothetical protein